MTLTLGSNIENLTLTGTTAINGTGNTLNNVLTGNSANNTLTGAAGNDTLDGRGGVDSLVGGAGADTYLYSSGYGVDSISENDTTAGVLDVVQFTGTVRQSDVRFAKVGNDLEVSVLSLSDKILIKSWYLGAQYHVERFNFTDGTTLTDAQAQALVGTMAAFAASAPVGQVANMLIRDQSNPSVMIALNGTA